MSQAGSNNGSGGGGGGLTTVINNTGTTTVTASQISILGDDTTADNANGITTTGSTSVTTILLTNRLQGSGISAAGSTENVITFALAATPTAYRFEFMVAARSTGGAASGQGATYSVRAGAKTTGAVASIISVPDIDSDEDVGLTGCSCAFVASANNVILQFTGQATDTIIVSSVGHYVQV